jgi:hypothetical protein
MRQDAIEMGIIGAATRPRSSERIGDRRAAPAGEPRVIDEAFAGYGRADCTTTPRETGGGPIVNQALVNDLAAQLAAIDRQRERLARLLESIETGSMSDS